MHKCWFRNLWPCAHKNTDVGLRAPSWTKICDFVVSSWKWNPRMNSWLIHFNEVCEIVAWTFKFVLLMMLIAVFLFFFTHFCHWHWASLHGLLLTVDLLQAGVLPFECNCSAGFFVGYSFENRIFLGQLNETVQRSQVKRWIDNNLPVHHILLITEVKQGQDLLVLGWVTAPKMQPAVDKILFANGCLSIRSGRQFWISIMQQRKILAPKEGSDSIITSWKL